MLKYAVEPWATYWPDAEQLWKDHWLEIAADKAVIPLDVDRDAYAALDAAGQLHIVTVRDVEVLVGYHLSIVRPHLHYKTTLHAFVDVYYLAPEYRQGLTGYRLFQVTERTLRALGVQKIMTGTKVYKDMSRLFERLQYRETERLWTKVLLEE
jgi:L-amino acid N-acyltransferase YncA